MEFAKEQVDLISRTVCKGCTPDELATFLHVCQTTGLDPLLRQVHPVQRWDRESNKYRMTIQTGIDGYRLVADRTGAYAPGREPSYLYDKDGNLVSSTAYVKKRTSDGSWHEVAATAFYSEYVGLTKDGKPSSFWRTKPHIMLSKCAEALALRRAFPAELAGIYTHEEMDQAGNDEAEPAAKKPRTKRAGPTADDVWGELMRMTGGDGAKTEALAEVVLGVSTADEITDPAEAMRKVTAYKPTPEPQASQPEPEAAPATTPGVGTIKDVGDMLMQMAGGDKAKAKAMCVELLGADSLREVKDVDAAVAKVGAAMAEFLKQPV